MNQIEPMTNMDLSGKILGCCFDIMNELGSGFLESVYKNALYYALLENGYKVETEKSFQIYYLNKVVGFYRADIVVDETMIIELKCCEMLKPEHQAQVINYLKASGLSTALLVNFGNKKVEFKRLYHPDNKISG